MKSGFRASMAWLHRWAGILFCALMYFIFVTGTPGYFHYEIDRWMQPERPLAMSQPDISSPDRLDPQHSRYTLPTGGTSHTFTTAELLSYGSQALDSLAASDAIWWGLILPTERNGNFWVEWQPPRGANGERQPRQSRYLSMENQEAVWVEPRNTGGGRALYRLHWRLHYLPPMVAYWIVGLCSLLMLVGLVSGVVIHRKLFREFFTLRLFRRGRSWLDLHNLSSLMAFPFQIMIVYTGLIFFALTFMQPIVSARYGDDISTYHHEAFPDDETQPRSGEAADTVALAPLLAKTQRETGQVVTQMYILHPGDRNAQLSFYLPEHSPTEYQGKPHRHLYNAATGERLPGGNQLYGGAASVEHTLLALHEGLFADWTLRWLYTLSGLLGVIMIATGALYWLKKRTAGDPSRYNRTDRFFAAILMGLPAAIAAYFWANRLLPAHWAERADWEMHSLFLCWLATGLWAAIRPRATLWQELAWFGAIVWAGLPLVNWLTTERHLGVTVTNGDWVLAGLDLVAVALALCFALMGAKAHLHKRITGETVTNARGVT